MIIAIDDQQVRQVKDGSHAGPVNLLYSIPARCIAQWRGVMNPRQSNDDLAVGSLEGAC